MWGDARIQGRCPKVSLWYAPCAGSSRRATPENSWKDNSPAAPRFLPSRPQLWEPRGGHGAGTLLWSQGRGRTRHCAWSAATPGRKCAQVLAEAPHEHLLLTADGSAAGRRTNASRLSPSLVTDQTWRQRSNGLITIPCSMLPFVRGLLQDAALACVPLTRPPDTQWRTMKSP